MAFHILYEPNCVTKRNSVAILVSYKINNDEQNVTKF